MRDFRSPPAIFWQKDSRGIMEPVLIMDGVTYNTEVSKFLSQKVASDPRAFEQTVYAGLMREAGVGKTRLESDMLMYVGVQDEASPESIGTFLVTVQQGTFGKKNIETVSVPDASHRSTFLTAVAGQIEWFNSRLGLPDPATGLVANLVNGGSAANLQWINPAATSSPILDYRVEWKRDTDTEWNSQNTNSVLPAATVRT